MPYWIAVDIGGTTLRAACFQDANPDPLAIRKLPANHTSRPALEQVTDLIYSIWPAGFPASAIGVSAPGPVDPFSGIVLRAPSIPDWVDFPLQQILGEAFQVPTFVGNDANLAALGEWKYGAGQGVDDLIYLTISTGIGGGLIVNGQLLLGKQGLAGELGHITVDPHGPLCSCGRPGHLEALASGPAIARWTEAQLEAGAASGLPQGKPLTCRQVAQAAVAGDPLARLAFQRAGTYLGEAISNFVNIFNPATVILGGGVSQSGELLLAPIRSVLARQVYSHHFLDTLKLTRAALGDNAGLLGAFELARTSSKLDSSP
jgi:glucokinase